jgi:putative membrane protein
MMPAMMIAAITTALLLTVRPAWAHGVGDDGGSIEWIVVLCCVLALFLYLFGVARAWRAGTRDGKPLVRQAAFFISGCSLLLLAIFPGAQRAAENSFAVHMVEHEVLMIGVAPLLIAARPLGMFAWALPASGRRLLAAIAGSMALRILSLPVVAWTLQGAALWAWHMPTLFQATLTSPAVHALQHASFLVTALLFWWSLFHGGSGTVRHGTAVLSLFATVMHSSLLGALLAVSPIVWYSDRANLPLYTLEDQQLAGIIMWVPGSLIYVAVAVWIVADWLRLAERRVRNWERAAEGMRRAS